MDKMTVEQLIAHRLDLQRDCEAIRVKIRAVGREIDKRHDTEMAKKLVDELTPAQRELLRVELQGE